MKQSDNTKKRFSSLEDVLYNSSVDTKSLVLIVDDPDAVTDPRGPRKIFDHWVLFNILPDTAAIA